MQQKRVILVVVVRHAATFRFRNCWPEWNVTGSNVLTMVSVFGRIISQLIGRVVRISCRRLKFKKERWKWDVGD
jgi:hypothetical protein